ncbi:MAG: helix-turn-helix transcriptional regulator [Tenericutes bacterium]|nr:helix-turn-helix transcriptional regulator [Mycoplasmatota bacterium]
MNYTRLFKVFSDENRVDIVKNLAKGVCCSCNFRDQFKISQPTLTYHLKMIKESGLATSEKVGTWNKYHMNLDVIDEMIKFLKEIKSSGGNECKC